jgi:hypothetical protein
VARNSSRRVKTVKVTSLLQGEPATTTASGSSIASALALRSTWFSIGVLSLQPPSPNAPVASGTRVRLTGVARGVRGVVLQARSPGGEWKPLKSIVPMPKTGAFHLAVKPKATTDYRLATAQNAAAYVRIRVT